MHSKPISMKDITMLGSYDFDSYWLTHASADSVFQWLRNNNPDSTVGSEAIEKALLERDEPLVKLGLALYGGVSDDAAIRLFRNGDMTIKKAVLAGHLVVGAMPGAAAQQWVFVILEEILQSLDDNLELLCAFLSNEGISDYVVADLFERKRHFKNLTDDQWIVAITQTIQNPCLRISSYHGSFHEGLRRFPMPGDRRFETAWRLFETMRVDDDSAARLSDLGEILAPCGHWSISDAPYDMDVQAAIKRWEKAENDDKYGWYRKCRTALGRLLEGDMLKDSDDVALRQAYYSGVDLGKPEDVCNACEKDKDKFLEVAVENARLYERSDIREALWQCCLKYGDTRRYGHTYRFESMCDWIKGQYPEWFAEFGETPPFDEVTDSNLRTEKRLKYLQKQIEAISEEVGTQSENIHKISAENQSNRLVLSKFLSTLEKVMWTVAIALLVFLCLRIFI